MPDPKPDPRAAERFVWGEGDVVIVRRGTPDQNSGAVAKRAPLADRELRLAERIDERRLAGEEQE